MTLQSPPRLITGAGSVPCYISTDPITTQLPQKYGVTRSPDGPAVKN